MFLKKLFILKKLCESEILASLIPRDSPQLGQDDYKKRKKEKKCKKTKNKKKTKEKNPSGFQPE